jgi:hypothetical protein
MGHRTTLLLDEKACSAARQLAALYSCSVSEAVRRSVVRQRDTELGLPVGRRHARVAALRRLFALFKGNNPGAEIRCLRAGDDGF